MNVPDGYRVVISAGVIKPFIPSLLGRWKWEVISPREWECRGLTLTRWGAKRKGSRIARRIDRRRRAAE